MTTPLITFTTDFGPGSPYVAALKGAALTVHPDARLLDLSHSLPPQDLRYASYFLRAALSYFPEHTLHVIVVDPGVGTERALLYVETLGQRLLVPDNGCWVELARLAADPPVVRRLTERRWWRPEVSATFHGRDILAPAAGHLSRGVGPDQLGPLVTSWVDFALPAPRLAPERWDGEVLFVDDFGNLLTNLPGDEYLRQRGRVARVLVGEHEIKRHVRTYGEAATGTLVVLVSSGGAVEVAEVNGSAARRLGARPGTAVRIVFDA
jgi:S-adenosylmethionine hydrolase